MPGCALCQDAHRCQRCRTGHTHLYLQGDQCVPECQRSDLLINIFPFFHPFPSKLIWVTLRGQSAIPCALECASSQGNATHSLRCVTQSLLLEHSCIGHCPDGHYPNEGECLRCPHVCLECSRDCLCKGKAAAGGTEVRISQCLSASECEEYYLLHKDQCVDDCRRGFFPSEEQKECVRCHADCT
ncbi:unnamed protein product [Coregonus sp. 'balchen']|nr:unnamed protein product [Coregonus sp. 'balchen']